MNYFLIKNIRINIRKDNKSCKDRTKNENKKGMMHKIVVIRN